MPTASVWIAVGRKQKDFGPNFNVHAFNLDGWVLFEACRRYTHAIERNAEADTRMRREKIEVGTWGST